MASQWSNGGKTGTPMYPAYRERSAAGREAAGRAASHHPTKTVSYILLFPPPHSGTAIWPGLLSPFAEDQYHHPPIRRIRGIAFGLVLGSLKLAIVLFRKDQDWVKFTASLVIALSIWTSPPREKILVLIKFQVRTAQLLHVGLEQILAGRTR